MSKFKPGDKVRMFAYGYWHYGEITIVSDQGNKVLFGGDGPDYWYYKDEELELITEEDLQDGMREGKV